MSLPEEDPLDLDFPLGDGTAETTASLLPVLQREGGERHRSGRRTVAAVRRGLRGLLPAVDGQPPLQWRWNGEGQRDSPRPIAPARSLLGCARHSGSRIEYTARLSKRSHLITQSRSTPSCCIPSFCITRPDAGLRRKCRASIRWSPRNSKPKSSRRRLASVA